MLLIFVSIYICVHYYFISLFVQTMESDKIVKKDMLKLASFKTCQSNMESDEAAMVKTYCSPANDELTFFFLTELLVQIMK